MRIIAVFSENKIVDSKFINLITTTLDIVGVDYNLLSYQGFIDTKYKNSENKLIVIPDIGGLKVYEEYYSILNGQYSTVYTIDYLSYFKNINLRFNIRYDNEENNSKLVEDILKICF